jgi:hypothetical protein
MLAVFRSATTRASVSARMSAPTSLAASAARRTQRAASRMSPCALKMAAVSSALVTSSPSSGNGSGTTN